MSFSLSKLYKNSEHGSLFLYACGVVLLLLSSGCQPQSASKQQLLISGPMMGTEYRVSLVLDSQSSRSQSLERQKKLETAVLDAMNSVNQSMSNYIQDSEISQFNRLGAHKFQALSPDFLEVMLESQQISTISDGAFDVTLGNAIDAWGFGPDGKITRRPSNDELAELKHTSGYQKLVLKNSSIAKSVDGLELSLSAIAKGYAVDKVAKALTELGVNDFLVNIGGELRASGSNIDGNVWRVGVEKPHLLGGIQEIVELKNAAIATSGDYRNFLLIDGEQFSHTIDPQSLKPVLHKLALVSVISARASTADALATAMMAMGEGAAWQFAQDRNLAAYMIIRGDNEADYQFRVTEKFRAYLQ